MNQDDKELIKAVMDTYSPQIKDLVGPACKEIGKGLGNAFKIIFYPVNILGKRIDKSFMLFEKSVADELSKIPEEKLVEPDLNKVGPILEAAKYYVEDGTLRDMFAKLLASACNKDTASYSHVAYVEILKQLTPEEANLTIELWKIRTCQCASIFSRDPNSGTNYLIMNYFLPIKNLTQNNYRTIQMYLENLIRLAIIEISDFKPIRNDNPETISANDGFYSLDYYDPPYLCDHPLYISIKNKSDVGDLRLNDEHEIHLQERYWKFTYFGSTFMKIVTGK